MVKINRSIYTRTRSRIGKYTSRAYEYVKWTVVGRSGANKTKKKEGVALLRVIIDRNLNLSDCEVNAGEPPQQTIHAWIEFVRWIKQPPGTKSLTSLLCDTDRPHRPQLARLELQIWPESNKESLYLDSLTNHLKAYDSFATRVTVRQARFFDNLAAALLKKTIKESTGDMCRPLCLMACGSLAKDESYNIPALARYYERIGFKRTYPAPDDSDDSDGIDMTGTTTSFLESATVAINNRWDDVDGPTKRIKRQI